MYTSPARKDHQQTMDGFDLFRWDQKINVLKSLEDPESSTEDRFSQFVFLVRQSHCDTEFCALYRSEQNNHARNGSYVYGQYMVSRAGTTQGRPARCLPISLFSKRINIKVRVRYTMTDVIHHKLPIYGTELAFYRWLFFFDTVHHSMRTEYCMTYNLNGNHNSQVDTVRSVSCAAFQG